ncbi:MAG: redoxin domain-containing protein [bacterium]|nr:redoxin domain-containing protein [bacterium]
MENISQISNTSLIDTLVPDITLEAFHENQIKKISLSDYRHKWLILFFYPGDFTFICPTELEEMAELYEQFRAEGAEALSVSVDSVYVHKAWYDHSPTIAKIKFPMLADPTGKLCQSLGVYLPNEGKALRGSFIIDPEGLIKSVEVNHNDIGRSAEELLRKLRAAKFVRENNGLVCPAKWKPGDRTLRPGLDLVGKI